jgi:hypothetical protein
MSFTLPDLTIPAGLSLYFRYFIFVLPVVTGQVALTFSLLADLSSGGRCSSSGR